MTGTDWGKVFKGLLIALTGAGLTYLTDTIPQINFGALSPIVAAGFSVLVNIARKWVTSKVSA